MGPADVMTCQGRRDLTRGACIRGDPSRGGDRKGMSAEPGRPTFAPPLAFRNLLEADCGYGANGGFEDVRATAAVGRLFRRSGSRGLQGSSKDAGGRMSDSRFLV